MGGCALAGALCISSFIKNSVTVVHAPAGCAHQVFSMLHAMINDAEIDSVPRIIVSNLSDKDVIFGGEARLKEALDKAADENPDLIVLVTSCVPETIGDDAGAVVCEHPFADKIISVRTGGFLFGTSKDGENKCLIELSALAKPSKPLKNTVALIGEKNLETEAEENYAEVERLLLRLGVRVISRFCRNALPDELKRISSASCFIQRDDRCKEAGEFLSERFQRPLVPEFPRGLCGCIEFLRSVGTACGIDKKIVDTAVLEEEIYQTQLLKRYEKLRGKRINLGIEPFDGCFDVAREAMNRLGMTEDIEGVEIRLPFYLPVGASGTAKMLNLWKRAVIYG